ncbi:uncharacterized protein TNCV_1161751 [Trichonephila clavipes]|nr:uncharacterized protein TNCV_1161751 [Trichonephila clavipes]
MLSDENKFQMNGPDRFNSFRYPNTFELIEYYRRTVQPHEGFLETDHVISNHGQVTWTTPELALHLLVTTPHQTEDVSALVRFNMHRCPTRRVFSGTGLELAIRQATIRYLYRSATAATNTFGNVILKKHING